MQWTFQKYLKWLHLRAHTFKTRCSGGRNKILCSTYLWHIKSLGVTTGEAQGAPLRGRGWDEEEMERDERGMLWGRRNVIPTFRKHWSAFSAHRLGPEAQSANGPLTGCRKESKIDNEKEKDGKMQAREKKERKKKLRNSKISGRMERDNIKRY